MRESDVWHSCRTTSDQQFTNTVLGLSTRRRASPLVHSEGVDDEVRRLRTLHGNNRRTR